MFDLSPNSPFAHLRPDCRRVELAVCETDLDPSPNAPVLAVATFQIKKRDTLDFTLDMMNWLATNGNAQLTGATWALASGSPNTPTIVGSAFSPQGVMTVVITPDGGDAPGSAYWLEVTIHIGETTPINPGEVAIPARTLVRRINIVVVAG